MNEDRWTKIETLIEQALDLAPEKQAAFIQKECGTDEELRKEITSLLQYKEQAFSFIQDFSENIVQPSLAELPQNKDTDDKRINTVVGHYQITDILGRGGMGVVYKARDTKLDRTVALKFLPSHLTLSNKDKQRFIREAKAAAALNHPNICTIHSVEEHEDQHFISMEYIDGQTLGETLDSGEITPEEALEVGIRIAGALAEAHEKGIVHRDIKPGNIMIDAKNRIKVTDFGLAKLVDSKPITQTGTTLGTMAYMAPEQIQGRPVDHRADLFSFGVLLFEMLTGQRPFGGQHDAALSYAIVNEEPSLLSDLLPNAPQKLSGLMNRLLQKDPAKRYSTTEELAGELKACLDELPDSMEASQKINQFTSTHYTNSGKSSRSDAPSITLNFPILRSRNGLLSLAVIVMVLALIGYWIFPSSGSVTPTDNTIAVLPLESISTDPEDIQFADGVHEELINRLAGISELKVIARSSVKGFEPRDRDLQTIGQQLGVSSLMEGTVRRIGDQLRVSVQLIDINTLSTIWSGSFDENIDNVFEIQSRIARQVAGELQASLTEQEQEHLEQRPTDNPQAYRLYMQGREYLGRTAFNRDNLLTAEGLLRKAVEQDREFAQVWGMLAHTYNWLYLQHGRHPEHLQKMREAAEWALFYGPELAETYLANGVYLYWSNTNNRQTLSHFETALQKFPNQPLLHFMTAYTHRRLGNWEKLIKHLNKALELDPLNINIHTEIAFDYFLMRNYDKAVATIERLMEYDPNSSAGLWFNAFIGISKNGTLDDFELWWKHIHPSDPAIEQPYRWGVYNGMKRDWEEALRGFKNIQRETAWSIQTQYLLRDYHIGTAFEGQDNYGEAKNYYEKAKKQLEGLRDEYPNEPRYRVDLGKVYARLGEIEKAIYEGEKATEMVLANQDAETGPLFEMDLAEIYAWTGHKELAIDKLEYLLSVPSLIHRNRLRLDPKWDPLRNHPRFQELIAGEDKPFIEGL